ncbi:hypothetical protein D3C85_1704020 [compost metagenome]
MFDVGAEFMGGAQAGHSHIARLDVTGLFMNANRDDLVGLKSGQLFHELVLQLLKSLYVETDHQTALAPIPARFFSR